MGKQQIKNRWRFTFRTSKSIFVMIVPAAVVCILISIVETGYANAESRAKDYGDVLKRSTEHSETERFSERFETIHMRVTAYCPCEKCCGRYSDGITANGHKIKPGDCFVAADPRYAFGTKMIIPGYKSSEPVKVLDRGCAIRGDRIDVFFGSHTEALKWGVQYLDVKVLYE